MPMENQDIDAAYAACEEVARTRALNFYYSFLFLPPRKRRGIYAAYAFSRLVDDLADDDIPDDEKRQGLARCRRDLSRCYEGDCEDPTFVALSDTVRHFPIPETYFQDLITGVEMDLDIRRYGSFGELYGYCYRVASVVGLICLEIFEYTSPRATQHAIDLGIAMQLTNILRDVKEDAELDRIYLPQEDLETFGVAEEEVLQGVRSPRMTNLLEFESVRARAYFDRGRKLLPLVPRSSRICPRLLMDVYGTVLDRIAEKEYDVFEGRTSLSGFEKTRLLLGCLVRNSLS